MNAVNGRTRPADVPDLVIPDGQRLQLPDGIGIELIAVTPEMAEDWLEHNNGRNRRPSEDRVPIFADMMRNGEFLLIHQGIAFDDDNQLADGQTRLAAIAASGVTVPLFVSWGYSARTRVAVDDTRKRTFAGDLQMNGIAQGHHVESLLRKILFWEDAGGLAKASWRAGPTRTAMSSAYPSHAQAIHDALPSGPRYKNAPVSQGSVTFMRWLLVTRTGCDPEVVARFFSILTIGSQEPADRVLISCKEMFTTGRYANGLKRPSGFKYEIYYLIQAWNLWVTGRYQNKWGLPKGGVLVNPYPKPVKAEMRPSGAPMDLDPDDFDHNDTAARYEHQAALT
jgi:hypothetical protein